jgi:GrpB-like predicted nucleotidyltransferase (UPF0157 family)
VQLETVLGSSAVGGIHHVGSTAVPGLEAKPIVDILVGVSSLESARPRFEGLGTAGYLYAPYESQQMHWFCKPHPSQREFHLHLVPVNSPRFQDELAFRDLLRSNAEVAREYVELKKLLAARFRTEREGYTNGKSNFIINALRPKEAADGELGPEDGGRGAAPAADPRLG